jgi:hypothetical protein
MSKKDDTAAELALAMILEQRKKLREQGKNPDKPVIATEIQKAFNDL